MKVKIKRLPLLIAALVITGTLAILLLSGSKQRGESGRAAELPPSPAKAEIAEVGSWAQGVQKVKEDRGEPTGRQAKVETPSQLRHYSDTRRFLAVQVAEWREHSLDTPRDFVQLADMLSRGELVELRPVSDNYVLIGVGGSADESPFTRYENGKSIALYSEVALVREYARIAESRANLENEISNLKRELETSDKRDRAGRAKLQTQIAGREKRLKTERESKELLDRYYVDAERRQQLFHDYQSLAGLAKSFSSHTYDVEDGSARRAMKVRMLSSLRPEALKVLEMVAASYREQFGRPLPVTSLVRTDEYQHALSKVNSNATRIQTPPHSTGLAFDIYYKFMTAEEQSYVMSYLARLKDEGRIEVLRENRDCYHVFAFVDGQRPDEALVRASLKSTSGAPEAEKESRSSE